MNDSEHQPAGQATDVRLAGYFWPLVVILSAVSVVPIWLCEYFPSHNGPSLLHIAYMTRELHNPDLGYSSFFDFHPFPVPYLLQTTALNVLFFFFSPAVADKIWVSLIVLLRPCAVLYFLRQLGRGREIYALACLPLVFDFCLMRGYYNYHAGVSLGFLVFGYYLRHRMSWGRTSTIVFNLLILLHYFTHPVALAVTGLLLAAYELAATRSPSRIVGIVIRGYIPSLALLTAFMVWSSRYGAWVEPDVAFKTISDKIQNAFFRGATPLSELANLTSLGLLAMVAVVGSVGLLRAYGKFSFKKIYVDPRLLVEQPMVVVFVVAIALYLLMPWNLIGWHKADVRLLPTLFVLLLAVPVPIVGRWRQTAFCGLATAVFALGLVCVAGGLKRASGDVAEYVAGIDAVPERSKVLPLMGYRKRSDDWKLAYAFTPLKRADAHYLIARGGASGNSLAKNNTLYWVWYKNYRDLSDYPQLETANPTQEQIDVAAAAYDAILMWEVPQELRKEFEARGFKRSFQQGRLTVMVRGNEALDKESVQ